MNVKIMYHVPRSQVWRGSRGGQVGNLHLYVDDSALCGRTAWYPRAPYDDEKVRFKRCSRCVAKAMKLGVEWPM